MVSVIATKKPQKHQIASSCKLLVQKNHQATLDAEYGSETPDWPTAFIYLMNLEHLKDSTLYSQETAIQGDSVTQTSFHLVKYFWLSQLRYMCLYTKLHLSLLWEQLSLSPILQRFYALTCFSTQLTESSPFFWSIISCINMIFQAIHYLLIETMQPLKCVVSETMTILFLWTPKGSGASDSESQ